MNQAYLIQKANQLECDIEGCEQEIGQLYNELNKHIDQTRCDVNTNDLDNLMEYLASVQKKIKALEAERSKMAIELTSVEGQMLETDELFEVSDNPNHPLN